MDIWKKNGIVYIKGSNFFYAFSLEKGGFVQMQYNGMELLKDAMQFVIARPSMDNDRNVRPLWTKWGVDEAGMLVWDSQIYDERPAKLHFMVEYAMGANSLKPILTGQAEWIVYPDGLVELSTNVHVRDGEALEYPRGRVEFFLPRFGLQLVMPGGIDQVAYFGYGPEESYIDKHGSTTRSYYETNVDALWENYLYPQENGAHYATSWVDLTDAFGVGFHVQSDKAFSFNASRYSIDAIRRAGHPFQLKSDGNVVVQLDYKQSGVGSGSCGPQLLPAYQLNEKEFTFRIQLQPFMKEDC